MRVVLVAVSLAISLLTVSSALAFELRLTKANYRVGDEVILDVGTTGAFTIENGVKAISKAEFIPSDKKSTEYSLGYIREPGFYTARVLQGRENKAIAFLALPKSGKWELPDLNLNYTPVPTEIGEALLTKFGNGLTRERMIKCVEKVVPEWLVKNSVGISTTAIVCVIPTQQATCAWGTTNKVADLGLEVLKEMVNQQVKDGVLTRSEGQKLLDILTAIKGAQSVHKLLTGDAMEKLLEGLGIAAEAVVESKAGKIFVKLSLDETKKIIVLIKYLKGK